MTRNDIIETLRLELEEYTNNIRPLHPDYGNGEHNEYDVYDIAYTEWLENLHSLIVSIVEAG